MEGKTVCEATCITLLGVSICFLDGNCWLRIPVPCRLRIRVKIFTMPAFPHLSDHLLPPTPYSGHLALGFWNPHARLGPLSRRVHSARTSLLSWLGGEPLPPLTVGENSTHKGELPFSSWLTVDSTSLIVWLPFVECKFYPAEKCCLWSSLLHTSEP